jgi:hypothetical protein
VSLEEGRKIVDVDVSEKRQENLGFIGLLMQFAWRA